MTVQLPTRPAFLRSNFPKTRCYLEGNWIAVQHTHSEVELFSSEQVQTVVSDSIVVETPAVAPDSIVAHSVSDSIVVETPTQPKTQKKTWFKTVLNRVLTLVISLSVLTGLALFAPRIYYTIFPADTEMIQPQEAGTPLGGEFDRGSQALSTQDATGVEPYLPPLDETLPEGRWLVIPRIGVRTELQRTDDPEEALKTGVWEVPDFGVPGDEAPVILAAHRFGWKWWWQSDYWKYHSFYLLPETEPGDQIEIVYDQRKWVYEIYAGEEGTEITDYSADVILYTCKFLDSPLRHIRYARLIDPTADSQSLSATLQ